MNSALLVIDLQNSFKDKTCEMYDKVLNFIKYVDNYDYYMGTVFVNEDIYGMYKNKLNYTECKEDTVDYLTYGKDFKLFRKSTYSVDDTIIDFIKSNNITHLDIVGCDSDACVLATCYKLFDNGIDFTILTDFIYSTSRDTSINDSAIKIMKRNFGSCVK